MFSVISNLPERYLTGRSELPEQSLTSKSLSPGDVDVQEHALQQDAASPVQNSETGPPEDASHTHRTEYRAVWSDW